MTEAQAIGVWGNHDFHLSSCPGAEVRQRYGPEVIPFMTSLRPRLDIQGCHCTHVEPWLNPEELADLWYFEGPPDSQDKLARIFAAGEQRLFFVGHYHSWLLATPDEILDWQGEQPIVLRPPQRFYVVIGALCQGRFAIFDTGTAELVPLQTE